MLNGVVVIMFWLTGVSRWVCQFNSIMVQFIFHCANQPISTGYAFFQVTHACNSFLLFFCTIYTQSTHQGQKSTVRCWPTGDQPAATVADVSYLKLRFGTCLGSDLGTWDLGMTVCMNRRDEGYF